MGEANSRSIHTINPSSSGDDERSSRCPFANTLTMRGGEGDNSYSTNSLLQKRVLGKAKPVLVKSTKGMMINLNFPNYVKVADLGCASGQNTFLTMSEVVNTINVLCQECNQKPPEIDCCLNDLSTNDFNTTFKFIPFFNERIESKGLYFVSGVPGSFYSRLFPSKSLHFVHSSYCLHWLSKVPEGLEKNASSVYITTSSLRSEYEAYLNQFQRDFTTFLKMRSQEMISNGRMVLTLLGRNTHDDPLYRDCCHIWTLLSKSLSDLLSEGLVNASKVESFKLPFYDADKEEVKEVIRSEGSFEIDDLEIHGFDLGLSNEDEDHRLHSHISKAGEKEAKCVRAASESMLVAHFGDDIIDALFDRCDVESDTEKYNGDDERSHMYPFVNALSMSGGEGDNSYSTNSLLQRRVLSKAKPILVKNIEGMMINLKFPNYIKVGDLGCASGQNTFLTMSEIVNTIDVLCQQRNQKVEIDCCLNDLSTNDFNTTFKLIPFFNKRVGRKGSCFVSGVPGSFYSRLFPCKSLHFVHSSYSLHFLSKVPEGLKKNSSSVYITTSSLPSEYKAYLNQFQRDFKTFLKLRSEEMVSNGRMVLTLLGRNTLDDPLYRDCCHFWTLLSESLRDLVSEGLVSASKVNSFKMPFYDPTKEEVKEVIRNEGSFEINDLELHGFDLGQSNQDEDYRLHTHISKAGQKEASCIRAVSEPLLASHFGNDIIDALFAKFAYHASQHDSCINKTTVSLVVSLIRK